MTDGELDVQDTIDALAEESTASIEEIEELLDLDAIRAEQGEVTEEYLRRHVAAVEQLHRMFGHHRDDEECELWDGIQDAKNDKFVRPDQDFEF